MDATITNLDTVNRVFIPGPQIDLAVSGDPDGNDVKIWPDVTTGDVDGNTRLKELVAAGTVSVSLTVDSYDAVEATQGTLVLGVLPKYAYASLPTGVNGAVVYCTDGRKTGEGAGVGTGVPAYWSDSDSDWHVFYDDSVLAI